MHSITQAKELFFKNLPIEGEMVRPEILESWKRSRDFGVDHKHADKSVLSPKELSNRIEQNRVLCEIAVPFMESIHTFTTGSGFLTTISDSQGYVLKIIGDRDIKKLARLNKLVEGCNRSERKLGTNAIGTPLEIGVPIQVFGDEHYYTLHNDWACSGAPIFNSDNSIVGVFCIIGSREKVSFHTLGMAAASAEAITRQIKMKAAQEEVEKTQKNLKSIIEHIPSGLLLLDKHYRIVEVNSRAERLFGLLSSELIGKLLFDLICDSTLTADDFESKISDRKVTLKLAGKQLDLSISILTTAGGEYLMSIDRAEVLHKKVNRIIGSNAHFVFDDIIGASPSFRDIIALAKIVAENNSSVLLVGESGTGKELFAQAIHNASCRSGGSFIAINCGALPRSLIESELFGYEGGSFTGSKREGNAGKFELANGGTIFLDEIGDMPLDVQVSLLRVLQTREIVRIGANRSVKIDVRVIAATNQNLQAAISANTFRSDLYYRLNVFNIQIPPLRDRKEDINILSDYFVNKYAVYSRQRMRGISEAAYRCLELYPWPGNVRELENVIERATYITKSGWISPDCLPDSLQNYLLYDGNKYSSRTDQNLPGEEVSLKKVERLKIQQALAASGGNVAKAARLLEISRRTLYRKIEKHNLKECVP